MTRFDVINAFVMQFGYKKYLEIGVNYGECISRVVAKSKDGVDPCGWKAPAWVKYPMTSDEFFALKLSDAESSQSKYDLIFIDGLHEAEQVIRDVQNSLRLLSDGGTILLHDCNPPTEWHASKEINGGDWNGTVYQAILRLKASMAEAGCGIDELPFVIDTDWGIGVIHGWETHPGPVEREFDPSLARAAESDWKLFDEHRNSLLNLVSVDQFNTWFAGLPQS